MVIVRCSAMLRLRTALRYTWWKMRRGEYRPAQLDHYRLRTWDLYRCEGLRQRRHPEMCGPCPTMDRKPRAQADS
jgi:hypothetical protein